jgi:hypothetical protein
MNFKTEISVEGKAIRGQIRNGEFHLVVLEKSTNVKPPMRTIVVDKEWIELAIEELKAVKEKM